jgi:hypothetical protein
MHDSAKCDVSNESLYDARMHALGTTEYGGRGMQTEGKTRFARVCCVVIVNSAYS